MAEYDDPHLAELPALFEGISQEHGTINASQASRVTRKGWKASHKLLLRLAAKGVLYHHHRTDITRDPLAHFVLAASKRQN
jgi:hypothetical protein